MVAELAALRRELAATNRELAATHRELSTLREENAKLREALERAQRGGKRQASPFSKGEPKSEPKTPGRKPGADYGNKGSKKVPAKADEIIDVPLPATCACGGHLIEERVAAQYQTEIPQVQPHVTRFDIHIGCCQRCGRRAQGRHPRQTSDALGAAASQLGPRALALATHFQKELGLSFGKAQALMSSVFGLEVTRGGLAQAVMRVAERLEPTHREIVASLPRAPVISPDETGWRVGGRLAWLWVFEAIDRVVYAVLPGRSFEDATLVLPADYSGALARDGWGPYRSYTQAIHQTCLNHLLVRCRELLEVAVRGAARVPHQVRRLLKDALRLRDRRDAHDVTEHGLRILAGKLTARLERLLNWRPTHDENRKLLAHLRREHEMGAVLGFLTRPEVPATNHRAEQAIRPAVVNRKTCGGNRTWDGAIAQSVLATVLGTVRRRHGDILEVIRRALCAPEPIVIDVAATCPGT